MAIKYLFKTEDEQEARDMMNALNYKSAIFEIRQKLRNTLKYEDDLSGEQAQLLEKLQVDVNQILSDNNVLEEL